MKRVRFRTTILALAVVSGSAITGVGLGRILTKVALAGDKHRMTTKRPTGSVGNLPGPGPEDVAARAAAMGLVVRPDYPLQLAPNPPNNRFVMASGTVNPLPMFTYIVTASADLGAGSFSGQIMGLSPFNRLKTTTNIPLQIVPLVITIDDGTTVVTYDPTAKDPCVPTGNFTDVDVLLGSPIFTNNTWTSNGVNVGNTQYLDAFQRAQFWSLVGGTPYHLILKPSVLAGQTLSVTVGNSSGPIRNLDGSLFGGCGFFGIMQLADLDAAVKALMTGPLAGTVNVGTFPVFLTKSVVFAEGALSNCCVLGYHSAFPVGANLQIYSPASLDTTGATGTGYTSTMAHEFGEAINDPNTGNLTPNWGDVGQVPMGSCQNNFEVGDPLTGTNLPKIVGANGLTYKVQELAFFSWFYGGPSLGTGGKFSNNGTFKGDAILCPPGGTN
jgi:hypothetical protein